MRRGAKRTKPKVKGKPPAARKSLKNAHSRVRDLEKRLAESMEREAEALQQQTATSEILRVISGSPTEVEPVFQAIVQRATSLCKATFATLHRFDGHLVTFEAHRGMTETEIKGAHRIFPRPADRETAVGRAILDRRITHIHDIRRDPDYRVAAIQQEFRTVLAVPLLREGMPLGALGLWRREVRPFSNNEIELLKIFADQAVIAIENVRLFTELQEKNRALTEAHGQVTEALEQQTATSEILRTISSSPTDVQPVFQTILDSAKRLLGAFSSMVVQRVGDQLHLAALSSVSEAGDARVRQAFPILIEEASTAPPIVTPILSRQPFVISDAETHAEVDEVTREIARARGYRSQLVVPMLREQSAIGIISVTRREAGGFTQDEVALLQTFADQAVIAIENVRLFKELEARNGDLTETLEQQTATAEILRVISSSPTYVQPVFKVIALSQ
jgi:GAF domain-containing protein